MLKPIFTLVVIYLIYSLGKSYSDTFFAGWVTCLLAQLVEKVIKLVCEKETK